MESNRGQENPIQLASNLFRAYLLENLFRRVTSNYKHGRPFRENLYTIFGINQDGVRHFIDSKRYEEGLSSEREIRKSLMQQYESNHTSISSSPVEIARELLQNYQEQFDMGHFGATGKKGSTFFQLINEFFDESGVVSELSVSDLARLALCRIKTELTDKELTGNVTFQILKRVYDILNSTEYYSIVEDFETTKSYCVYRAEHQYSLAFRLSPEYKMTEYLDWFLAQPQVLEYRQTFILEGRESAQAGPSRATGEYGVDEKPGFFARFRNTDTATDGPKQSFLDRVRASLPTAPWNRDRQLEVDERWEDDAQYNAEDSFAADPHGDSTPGGEIYSRPGLSYSGEDSGE